MRVPQWLIVSAAVVMALPFGYGLGLLAAFLIAGKEFGQLPMITVPAGLLAACVFALVPLVKPATRLGVLFTGALLFTGVLWWF